MSLPFPFPTITKKTASESNTNNNNNNNKNKASISYQYLNADERWEVYQVKAAERPNLLLLPHAHNNNEDEEKKCSNNTEEEEEAALIDGCDIPGWRKEKIIPLCFYLDSILNIGSGAGYGTYFKRDRQWGVFDSNATNSWWIDLKINHLDVEPHCCRNVSSIEYEDACCIVSEGHGIHTEEHPNPNHDNNRNKATTRFSIEYEATNTPAKILQATKGWKAANNPLNPEDTWTFSNFVKRFGAIKWRFSDLHGSMMELKTYERYIYNLEGLTDDSPLAIYDSDFGSVDSACTNMLLEDYEVPRCFSSNLFDMVEDVGGVGVAQPPYRWILIGPERSGTGMHVDPLMTNAWVTILQGKKRWMLFPPSCPSHLIGLIEGQPDIPSVIWFRDYYSKVTANDWPTQWKPIEVLQLEGETVFVPQGWKHVVLNLTLTVAITHNYASEYGDLLGSVWKDVKHHADPVFARVWYERMCVLRPDLVHLYFDL